MSPRRYTPSPQSLSHGHDSFAALSPTHGLARRLFDDWRWYDDVRGGADMAWSGMPAGRVPGASSAMLGDGDTAAGLDALYARICRLVDYGLLLSFWDHGFRRGALAQRATPTFDFGGFARLAPVTSRRPAVWRLRGSFGQRRRATGAISTGRRRCAAYASLRSRSSQDAAFD